MSYSISHDPQNSITVPYEPNEKQKLFHACAADEVVYGGAKGGGKSCSLVMEALAYGLEHPNAEIYLFRETYDDLEANLIKEWKEKVPRSLYGYNESKHIAALTTGTAIKFRFISSLADAERYQGRSMDFIGVDELTKHLEESIQILLSCLRSPKGFPPVFKGTCNPGGIGHTWVKERYIVPTNYGAKGYVDDDTGNTIAFIPAKVYDNTVLMKNDPKYVRRLENLPDDKKKAYLHGDWDIFQGQYFSEFKRDTHVCKPFVIPTHWRRYVVLDYGLDMLAAYDVAVDTEGRAYFTNEIYQPDLIISDAAQAIKTLNKPYMYIAPPDLWNRRQETAKSVSDIFWEHGIMLTKSGNDRVDGWMAVKEWLKSFTDVDGATRAKLTIFDNCTNLIRCLPALQYDSKDPNDTATQPHEITHAPDALRYFCISWTSAAIKPTHTTPSTLSVFYTNSTPTPTLGQGDRINVI